MDSVVSRTDCLDMERISQLFKQATGHEPLSVRLLAGAGSNRKYFRVCDDSMCLIAVIGTNKEENSAFISLSQTFTHHGLPVPKVIATSDDGMVYLQEDLGDQSLYSRIAKGRDNGGNYSEEEIEAIAKTIRQLPSFQFLPIVHQKAQSIFAHCYPQDAMDRTSVFFDLNYFKYCFLKLKEIEFNEYKLQHDFEALADALLEENEDTFLYRDFQSRNVMLKDGEPYFIDFQGGRKGPIYYDVASFLWQSSANFSDNLRQRLIDEYLKALQPYKQMAKETFMPKLHLFVLFRILQVLGAYGYRGLWEKKEYFVNSIPLAIGNLEAEISLGTCDAYPYLKEVCQTIVSLNDKEEKEKKEEAEKKEKVTSYLANDNTYLSDNATPLTVRIFSFAFKHGIPADESGNGGGYVFDCRSTHNPGRYEEYKPLTGLDQPVIDFLETDGEILDFLTNVYKIADFHVNRFIERGFANMQISFGCTGGRHRSVYSAQHTAEHIHQKFGVKVILCHREQNITQVFG